MSQPRTPHVVIIGGGFGGLYAAQALGNAACDVTLIDRRNFHLFQPLLYQVAAAGLSPGEIASPLRAVLNKYNNIRVYNAEVTDLDPDRRCVILRDGEVPYDILIVATGVSHFYFGHDEWEKRAPGLKTIEDAIDIRHRIFKAFEAAERMAGVDKHCPWMRFVIVGGGPTGVELAGAIGELAHVTLKHDFKNIDTRQSEIVLLEGTDRILPQYPPELSAKAAKSLERLGVTVRTGALVTDVGEHSVTVRSGDQTEQIEARTVLWAAGVRASAMSRVLAERVSAPLDRAGRVLVEPDLTVPGHPEILVVGDLASLAENGKPVPGVAPAAMQQGEYAANLIKARLKGKQPGSFHYWDKGSLAVIGRNAAVADLGPLHFNGRLAWFAWIFIHIFYLIEFDNKFAVIFQWAWNYFTRKRGARLITGQDSPTLILDEPQFHQNGQEKEQSLSSSQR